MFCLLLPVSVDLLVCVCLCVCVCDAVITVAVLTQLFFAPPQSKKKKEISRVHCAFFFALQRITTAQVEKVGSARLLEYPSLTVYLLLLLLLFLSPFFFLPVCERGQRWSNNNNNNNNKQTKLRRRRFLLLKYKAFLRQTGQVRRGSKRRPSLPSFVRLSV